MTAGRSTSEMRTCLTFPLAFVLVCPMLPVWLVVNIIILLQVRECYNDYYHADYYYFEPELCASPPTSDECVPQHEENPYDVEYSGCRRNRNGLCVWKPSC